MDGNTQKVTEENKPNELEILNPTMKEIEKLEKESIDDNEPDILGDFKKNHEKDGNKVVNFEIDKEEDEAFINHIHRMSMRKVEIGRMRSKLITNSFSKDKYVDEVNIDKDRALKMADNIFKRRLKFLNKNKEKSGDFPKNTSENFQFSPQPFIKRLISRIDTEGNDTNNKINVKKNEVIGLADDYKDKVTKTEHNIENYAAKSNNKTQKETNAVEIKVNLNANANINTNKNANKKTLSRGNLYSKSYTNIRNNNITISTRGNRNNNQNLNQAGNQNTNKNDNRKDLENKDIKDRRLNRNNNRVMSHTNIFEAKRTNPQVITSPRVNEVNTSRRRPANITTEIKIPNISSSRSPRNANNIKVNVLTSPTKTNANQVPNNTRGNRGNNPSKITPIPLPLDKINKQINKDQRGNNTSRQYNRPNISKPLEIEVKNNYNNNNRRSQNKVESKNIQKNDNKTLTNEPRRRNANNQINANVRQTGNLPVKTEVKNYPNTSRGNQRNKIDVKNQVTNTSRGNERNKVEIKNQVTKTSRGNERNKVEIKIQATSNRRGNNQTTIKSPGKVENKKVVITTTSGRRGIK